MGTVSRDGEKFLKFFPSPNFLNFLENFLFFRFRRPVRRAGKNLPPVSLERAFMQVRPSSRPPGAEEVLQEGMFF
jgi:hypothetical protein